MDEILEISDKDDDELLSEQKKLLKQKLLDKKMNCPICEYEFTTLRVRMPKIRLFNTDTDLRPYYEGIDVVAYEPVTCPSCGYSSIYKTFYDVTEATKENIREYLKENYKKREWPELVDTQVAIEKFLLALQCLQPKRANVGEQAYIYLKLSWLFRVHTNNDKREANELFCQKKFVESAEQTFAEVRFPILDWDESVFLYLIGEVCRRIGDYERAYKYIGKIIVDRNVSEKLRERARDVKEMIKEERPKIEEAETGV